LLKLGESRVKLLGNLLDRVSQVWASFDTARESEPVSTPDVEQILAERLPRKGRGENLTLVQAGEILDQSTAQSRPRFFAFIGSSGLEIGAVADFLTSSYDINLAVDSRAASVMERQTAAWLGEFIGYSSAAKGLFTSGGTVSNITALAAARTAAFPESRRKGVQQATAIYCSAEAHYSNQRAVELLGLGSDSMRSIGIDENRRMKVAELVSAIENDLANGVVPLAVIASAGTTLTGAVDPLDEIADVCAKYQIWMHVDGAYGAPAAGTATAYPLFKGLSRADSVTVDAHKWLFVPKACSILLTKDYTPLARTFSHNEAYMPHDHDEPNPVDVTLEYSRPVRALKLWMGFASHGADEFAEAIESNLALARYTYDRAKNDADFAVLPHAPQLSIVPIRYAPAGAQDLNALNKKIYERILGDGRIYLSPAEIDGQTWLRPCYTNFRTTQKDVDVLFDVVAEIGKQVAAEH
jgi:aromatic-L-amino-acid/L-tryptophan decarboxylase